MKTLPTRLLLSTALWLGLSGPAMAAFQLNQFSLYGDANFFDDFEDTVPTTMLNFSGSTTTESGGALNFSSADGGMLVGGGAPGAYIRDEVFANILLPEAGSGGTYVTGWFDSDLSQLTSNPLDTSSGFGISILGTGTGAQLGVFNNFDLAGTNLLPAGAAPTPTIFFNDLTYGGALNGYDRLDPGTIVGDIILDMYVDPVTNLIFPSYSIDGGTTYITADLWDSASDFGTFAGTVIYPSPNDVIGTAFGQTAVVPLPPAFALMLAPLAMLGALSRRRQHAL